MLSPAQWWINLKSNVIDKYRAIIAANPNEDYGQLPEVLNILEEAYELGKQLKGKMSDQSLEQPIKDCLAKIGPDDLPLEGANCLDPDNNDVHKEFLKEYRDLHLKVYPQVHAWILKNVPGASMPPVKNIKLIPILKKIQRAVATISRKIDPPQKKVELAIRNQFKRIISQHVKEDSSTVNTENTENTIEQMKDHFNQLGEHLTTMQKTREMLDFLETESHHDKIRAKMEDLGMDALLDGIDDDEIVEPEKTYWITPQSNKAKAKEIVNDLPSNVCYIATNGLSLANSTSQWICDNAIPEEVVMYRTVLNYQAKFLGRMTWNFGAKIGSTLSSMGGALFSSGSNSDKNSEKQKDDKEQDDGEQDNSKQQTVKSQQPGYTQRIANKVGGYVVDKVNGVVTYVAESLENPHIEVLKKHLEKKFQDASDEVTKYSGENKISTNIMKSQDFSAIKNKLDVMQKILDLTVKCVPFTMKNNWWGKMLSYFPNILLNSKRVLQKKMDKVRNDLESLLEGSGEMDAEELLDGYKKILEEFSDWQRGAENLAPITVRDGIANEADSGNTANKKITQTPFSLFKESKFIDRFDRMTFCRDKNQEDIEKMRQVLDNAVNDAAPQSYQQK